MPARITSVCNKQMMGPESRRLRGQPWLRQVNDGWLICRRGRACISVFFFFFFCFITADTVLGARGRPRRHSRRVLPPRFPIPSPRRTPSAIQSYHQQAGLFFHCTSLIVDSPRIHRLHHGFREQCKHTTPKRRIPPSPLLKHFSNVGSEASLRRRGHQGLPCRARQRTIPHPFRTPDFVAAHGSNILGLR